MAEDEATPVIRLATRSNGQGKRKSSLFGHMINPLSSSLSKKRRKEFGQYPAISTENRLDQ